MNSCLNMFKHYTEATGVSSPLCNYLTSHFPPSCWVSVDEDIRGRNLPGGGNSLKNKWSDRELMEHFFTRFAVNVFTEGSVFYQFKYDMSLTESWNEEVKEARGIIFERRASNTEAEGWIIAARPFEKFFNQQESECPISNPKVFADRCSSFAFSEKADGTCIQLWWASPHTLAAAYEMASQSLPAAGNEVGPRDTVEEGATKTEEVHKDVEDPSLTGEGVPEDLVDRATLIERRARRFKKVLPYVFMPDRKQGEGEEKSKHMRGLIRMPKHHHVGIFWLHSFKKCQVLAYST